MSAFGKPMAPTIDRGINVPLSRQPHGTRFSSPEAVDSVRQPLFALPETWQYPDGRSKLYTSIALAELAIFEGSDASLR
jgi:hypothetical protein